MNRALRRISIAVLVMFLLLLINVNYLQGFEPASLASKPGNSRAFYAAQNQYERGSIVTSDGVTIAASKPSSGSIKYQRYYPLGPEYAPVTGYDTLYSQTGVEAAENSLLSGNDSSLDVRKVIDLITGKTTKGATVEVTINSKAQDAAYNALAALGKPGGVVALNPKTGAILAMASYPSFNPTLLAVHDGTQLNNNDAALLKAPGDPLFNRALQLTLPPGSTFKIVTSSALLTQSPSTTINTNVDSPTQLTLPQTTHVLHQQPGRGLRGRERPGAADHGVRPVLRHDLRQDRHGPRRVGAQRHGREVRHERPEPDRPAARGAEQLRDTGQPGADRLLGDRPVQRHGHPAAGSHVRRGHRQQRHADEALPGAAGHRQRPEHGPVDPAVRPEPAGHPVRCQ